MTKAILTQRPAKPPRKMAREPQAVITGNDAQTGNDASPSHEPEKRQTKSARLLALLSRPEGATLDQLVSATGWLPHTTRAALTGLKKKGHAVTSAKPENGPRIYRIAVRGGDGSDAGDDTA